jgi:uncharacterized protein
VALTVPVLVFSATAEYRHESIPAGVSALASFAEVSATEDPSALTHLDGYAAVVFLNTSGTVLRDAERAALMAYVNGGGGFLGVHCAAATEADWPEYGDLVGARFADHPEVQSALITVEERDHPATAHLGPTWRRTDEWYNFVAHPGPRVRVLLRVDEESYHGGTMGPDHPLAWCHAYGQGRAAYTALGHTVDSYDEPEFRAHLRGLLAWVGGT